MFDELLHHLVTEMAMDGEEGCSVARLDGFIDSYYDRRRARYPAEPTQFVDESYKNFVWRQLCQLEPVRLGVLESAVIPSEEAEDDSAREPNPNVTSSVESNKDTNPAKSLQLPIIASKAANKMTQRPNRLTKSTKNRSKNEVSSSKNTDGNSPCLSIGQLRALETGKVQKSYQIHQAQDLKKATATGKLTVTPSSSVWRELDPALCTLSREELLTKFGLDEDGQSKLKIAVDPMTCWKAVVGTDTRSPKLTPYVYQVLTIVAQGREAGATVVELGRKLKHDQKSLFHFVKVLVDLQLVVKFRAYQHKSWTNRVVHRRYLATSEWYRNSIKKDEDHQNSSTSQAQTASFDLGEYVSAPIEPFTMASLSHNASDNQTMGNIIHSSTTDDPPKAAMSPINREVLAVNENLVKSRMFNVLKRSPENTMIHADIIKAIGIANPTKDERRRLNRLIDAYIKRGLVERVAVVNMSGNTPCIRLTALGEESMHTTSSQPRPITMGVDGQELEEELCVLPITRSIGQTIYDLLENAGQEGIIYKTLCYKLNDIEIRTAEQILTRMEREQGPPHLSHLKVSSVLETSGREKRVRWFSSQGLKAKCQASGIMLAADEEDPRDSNVGGFIDIDPSTLSQIFYENAAQLYGRSVPEPKGNWGKWPKKASRVPATGRRGKSSQRAARIDRNSLQQKNNRKDSFLETHVTNTSNSMSDGIPSKRAVLESLHDAEPKKRSKRGSHSGPPVIEGDSLPSAITIEQSKSATQLHPQPRAPDLLQHSNEPSPQKSPPPSIERNKPVTSITPPVDTPGGLLKTRGARQNLTSLRREFHLLEAIKFAGGIVEKTNELAKAVRDLVDRADQDQVVILMDNRTLNFALHGLEARGEIKLTTVLVTDALGASCLRKIIYLPSIPLDGPEIRKWLEDLKVRFKTLDKATEAHVNQHKDFASPVHRLPPRSASNLSPLPNALGVNDEVLHAAFLNQWRCLSQLYGFVLGKAARAKILHLHILKTFNDSSQASSARLTINSGHRIFSSGFLFQELPVRVFAKLVPIMAKNEEFEKLRETPGALETPMNNTPVAIRRLFQIGNQFSRVKVYQIVEVLFHLKLIVPLQKSSDSSEFYRIGANGEPSYYSPCPMCTTVGLFCLANEGHVHEFSQRSQNPPPVLSKWPLKNEHDGERFWEELERASIPNPEAPPTKNVVDCEDEKLFNGPPKLLQMLTDQSKWRDGIQLTPTQREYIHRFTKQTSLTHDLETDDQMISNIARVLVTVPEAVRQAIRGFREAEAVARAKKAQKALNQPPRKRMKKRAPELDAESLKVAQEKAAKVLADKAKNALKQKEGDWNSIIKRFKTQSGITEIDEAVLKDLHKLFTTSNGGINAKRLESELTTWLKRKRALQEANSMEVDKGTELLVEIENTIGSSKRSMLPALPSAKAKRIKMLKAKPIPRRLRTKQIHLPRVLPEKPRSISAVAANAIRPQPDVEIGLRPSPCVTKPGQRIRIEWDESHDEFLRDMVAIMRVRAFATCAHVLPWPITMKLFIGARTHILRNRHAKLERDPKEKRYLDLLTEAWTHVYFDNRGKVPELADPTPRVAASFDGGLALDFLRSNIDKAYLRSHVSLSENDEEKSSSPPLPRTCDELRSNYKVRRMLPSRRVERWDEIDSFPNSVVREMSIITEAFTGSCRIGTRSEKSRSVSHEVLRACEAIKLLTSTPIKIYSEPIAAATLSHYPDELLVRATDYLCLKGVIAIGGKLHYKKRLPGRSYCYTDKYLSNPDTRALKGPRDTSFTRLRTDSMPNSEKETTWSLLASDTETASLLHAYSRGEVLLRIGTNPNRSKIWDISNFYRTRKLDDHCIENSVQVIFQEPVTQEIIRFAHTQPLQSQLDLVNQVVLQAGPGGLTTQDLAEQLSSPISQDILGACVQHLTKVEPPKLHWGCNETTAILFSSDYLQHWAQKLYVKAPNNVTNKDHNLVHVVQHKNQVTRVIPKDPFYLVPRLWMDLSGDSLKDLRQLSMDRVENLIQTFPGLPYDELTRRTKLQLNPLELDDVLEELVAHGKVVEHEYGPGHLLDVQDHQIPSRWVRGFDRQRHFWTPA